MTTNGSPPAGLLRPDLAEARRALERIYGTQAQTVWADLLAGAELDGGETEPDAIERLVDVMRSAAPVTALCGEALAIRVAAHDRLAQARALMGDSTV